MRRKQHSTPSPDFEVPGRDTIEEAARPAGPEIMPPGKYWVGDLCYVMHGEWDEVHRLLFPPGNHDGVDGVHTLKDGRRFAVHWTAYGDGSYMDRDGRDYGVDSGSIGCILLKDIRRNRENRVELGHVIDFPEPFLTGSRGGKITFGKVVEIETDDCEGED